MLLTHKGVLITKLYIYIHTVIANIGLSLVIGVGCIDLPTLTHTYVYILLNNCSVRHHLFSWLIINYSGTTTYWPHNLTKICNSLILFWQSYSFRRGTYPSTIFSLSFAPSMQLPDILVGTSSSGSVHAFSLGFFGYQRWEIHLNIPFRDSTWCQLYYLAYCANGVHMVYLVFIHIDLTYWSCLC